MRYVLSAITALLFSLALFAQQFEPMVYDGLQYQQLANKTDGAEKPALVIFLHGGHARGEDNQKQIQLPAVKDIKDYILKNNMPAYFLAPQCPSNMEWLPNRGAPGCKDKVLRYTLRSVHRNAAWTPSNGWLQKSRRPVAMSNSMSWPAVTTPRPATRPSRPNG